MKGIQLTKPARQKWNRLLDALVTIMKYKKITIDHAIYIKVFYDETVSYIMVSTDNFLSTINNETAFPELTRVFKERFEMKAQEGYLLKYLNFRVCQYPLSLSVDQTDHITEIVNEWFPTGKLRRVNTHFTIESTYEKKLMAAIPMPGNALHKSEI